MGIFSRTASVPLSTPAVQARVAMNRREQQRARDLGADARELYFEDQMNTWLDVLCERLGLGQEGRRAQVPGA